MKKLYKGRQRNEKKGTIRVTGTSGNDIREDYVICSSMELKLYNGIQKQCIFWHLLVPKYAMFLIILDLTSNSISITAAEVSRQYFV